VAKAGSAGRPMVENIGETKWKIEVLGGKHGKGGTSTRKGGWKILRLKKKKGGVTEVPTTRTGAVGLVRLIKDTLKRPREKRRGRHGPNTIETNAER